MALMTSVDPNNKQNETFAREVREEDVGVRVDRWLAGQLTDMTRSRLKALIKDGHLTRDGVPFDDPSWKVRLEETYELIIPPVEDATPKPENIPLDVLYEDDDLIVINKPAGMVVHPAAGNWSGTLVNALLHHCGDSLSGIGGVARPGIVHRLDKETSGVMVVAKHDKAHAGLTSAFSVHDIDRVYHAIVHGAPRPGIGTVNAPMMRENADRKKMGVPKQPWPEAAKHAVTHYKSLETFGRERARMPGDALASLIECRLETGRTHQIRVHMSHIGHPLLGDPLYGRGSGLAGLKPGDPEAEKALKTLTKFRRQALHARLLGFEHPITGAALSFETAPPADFQGLASALMAL